MINNVRKNLLTEINRKEVQILSGDNYFPISEFIEKYTKLQTQAATAINTFSLKRHSPAINAGKETLKLVNPLKREDRKKIEFYYRKLFKPLQGFQTTFAKLTQISFDIKCKILKTQQDETIKSTVPLNEEMKRAYMTFSTNLKNVKLESSPLDRLKRDIQTILRAIKDFFSTLGNELTSEIDEKEINNHSSPYFDTGDI